MKDAGGTALSANHAWSLTTGAADPASVSPALSATAVALNTTVSVVFSSAMTESSFDGNMTLADGNGTAIAGTTSYSSATKTLTFTPTSVLGYLTTYTAALKTGIKDSNGYAIFSSNYTWTFTTTGVTADASKVTGGTVFTCGIKSDGTLYCWGKNDVGQVGRGDTVTPQKTPRLVTGASWSSVSAGDAHACAIRTNGDLYCWGYNADGELGTDAPNENDTPVLTGSGYSFVSTGYQHTCGIKTDGTLLCWGDNTNNQLGGGSNPQNTPIQIGAETTWVIVSSGENHTCAIRTNGALYCWGDNSSGQCGDPALGGSVTTPQRVGTDSDWAHVSAGSSYTCAVKSNGNGYCWGAGTNGRLGNGTTDQKTSPTALSVASGWSKIAAKNVHTCGIKTDGSIYCWGNDTNGRLGDNATTQQASPTAPTDPSGWASIVVGGDQSCAIKSQGNAFYCWGANGSGELGDGTQIEEKQPTLINF
ncbi:MAG: Ig-like domain-containing protein [Pseudomonadota bacterium]